MDVVQDKADDQLSLSELVNAIRTAAKDSNIDGLLLECNGASAGLAQCEEIINAIDEFKKSGKWVWAYSDNYTQSEYFIAVTADSVFLNPVGMVDIHGLSAQTMFFKDLMDKVGVEAQVVKVGTYKRAIPAQQHERGQPPSGGTLHRTHLG
jgi:protease-4